MPSAKDLADELLAEFGERNIGANVSLTDGEYACNASINNIPVSVFFSTDAEAPEIRWLANTETHRVSSRDVTASDLAEQVIDTFLNPA